jgi:hypothetical protein
MQPIVFARRPGSMLTMQPSQKPWKRPDRISISASAVASGWMMIAGTTSVRSARTVRLTCRKSFLLSRYRPPSAMRRKRLIRWIMFPLTSSSRQLWLPARIAGPRLVAASSALNVANRWPPKNSVPIAVRRSKRMPSSARSVAQNNSHKSARVWLFALTKLHAHSIRRIKPLFLGGRYGK